MATGSHLQLNQNMGNEEFPILCGTCLGPNPFVRMTMEQWGKACKICERPFTVYKWKPGKKARFKTTEICYTCAKLKNVCQTCVLDLKYGLPVQVIESVLNREDLRPKSVSDVGRRYLLEQAERDMNRGNYEDYSQAQHEILEQLARRTPYYKRNEAKLCTFFARGECNRGDDCPFRHEMPKPDGPLARQNIRDRYAGTNDPVAAKLLARVGRGSREPGGGPHGARLVPPEDPTITTLWVGGIDTSVTEMELRLVFEEHAPVKQVRMVPNKNFAFVNLHSRAGAEKAARNLHNNISIRGVPLRLAWGKRKAGVGRSRSGAAGAPKHGVVNPDAVQLLEKPPAAGGESGAAIPPPPILGGVAGSSSAAVVYPSQDPRNFAAKLDQ